MSSSTTPAVPPGWHPDPAGSPRSRWWDGTQWTEHFYDPATGIPVAELKAPAGTPVYNVWIWLVAFLPYITLPFLFTINFGSMFSGIDPTDTTSMLNAEMAIFLSPGYLILSLGSWVILAAVVVCAYRDWKWLHAAGVPKPFHWAWSFLGVVYPIGRAVVTRRRTGHGSAILWAAIAMMVVSFVVYLIWSAMLMASMMQLFSTYPYAN